MEHLTSIVAANHEGVIGSANTLPWRLKTDMRFFRDQTIGNIVLMGRKTFDSLGRKPLPNRYNIVISHHFNLFPETKLCKAASSIEDALFRATLAPKQFKEVFIIGGASMYEQFAPFVDRYLITWVDKHVPDGDTYFDEALLGDPHYWNVNHINSIEASAIDEAPFSIFDITSTQSNEIKSSREEAINRARLKATANRSQTARFPTGQKSRSNQLLEARTML